MSQLAVNIEEHGVGLYGIEGGKDWSESNSRIRAIPRDVAILGTILALLQVLDGILTGIGIAIFGISAEGNILLRSLMEIWGPTTTLIAAKSMAIVVVFLLCLISRDIKWVKKALKGLIAVYLLAAIIPWTFLILSA